MTTFTFNAEHFDFMFDRLFEGKLVTLVKANKTCLTIQMNRIRGEEKFDLTLSTPGGIDLHAYEVFTNGELFGFLDGLLFTSMNVNE
jgi:hypothetical protein